eukprot:1155161-Pelagomonas_calceolata.AAC.3
MGVQVKVLHTQNWLVAVGHELKSTGWPDHEISSFHKYWCLGAPTHMRSKTGHRPVKRGCVKTGHRPVSSQPFMSLSSKGYCVKDTLLRQGTDLSKEGVPVQDRAPTYVFSTFHVPLGKRILCQGYCIETGHRPVKGGCACARQGTDLCLLNFSCSSQQKDTLMCKPMFRSA